MRAREVERKAAQASLVSAWSISEETRGEGAGVVVRFRSASELPIYRCTIIVRPDWGEYVPSAASDGEGTFYSVIGPGSGDESFVIPAKDPPTDLLTLPPAEIMFTDAAGAHWRRRTDGRLEPLADNVGGAC